MVTMTQALREALFHRGIECFPLNDVASISDDAVFEPPCGPKLVAFQPSRVAVKQLV